MTTTRSSKNRSRRAKPAKAPSLRDTPVSQRIAEGPRDRAASRRQEGIKHGEEMRRARSAEGFKGED